MAQTNAIVGNVLSIGSEESLGADVRSADIISTAPWVVHLEPGGSAFVRPQDVDFRETLELLRDIERPAYVSISDGREVADVLIPLVGRVDRLRQDGEGNLHVGLDRSAKHLVLKAEADDRDRIARLLQRSFQEGLLLAVTDAPDDEAIISAEEAPVNAADWALSLHFGPFGEAPSPASVSIISEREAEELYALVSSVACDFPEPTPGCIPFSYPDDGCFARAHRMVDMLQKQGVRAGKVWAYGDLRVRTENHPDCRVRWDWHVAPFVRIPGGSGRRVLDPSLFDQAVPLPRWVGSLGDRDPLLHFTSGDVYLRKDTGEHRGETTKPRRESVADLAKYRQRLKRRRPHPPYKKCKV